MKIKISLVLVAALIMAGCADLPVIGPPIGGLIGQPTSTPNPPPTIRVTSTDLDQRTLVVRGEGTPGADIEYQNARAGGVNPDGRFVVALPVERGQTLLILEAVNRYGRTATQVSVPASAVAPGRSAALGKVSFRLITTQTLPAVGAPPIQQRPEGVYLRVAISVTNHLDEAVRFQNWHFALLDAEGREHKPSEPAEFAFGWETAEGRLSGRVIPPGITAAGWLIFDLAPSALDTPPLTLVAFSGGVGPQWAAELAILE